jgi:hypothetical protein
MTLTLKEADGWGVRLIVRFPCGHEAEVLREHVGADGVIAGRLECLGTGAARCGRVFDDVKLEGWPT